MINPGSKGLYVPFSTQLKFIISKFKLYSESKDELADAKIFDGKKELVKCMHGYALGYLRHLRAFNFNESCSLAQLIFDFLKLLLDDPYESLTKISKLEAAYFIAWKHLDFKAQNDPQLQDEAYFQTEIAMFKLRYDEFKADYDERVKQY